MEDNTRSKSILITIAIILVGAGLLSVIIPELSQDKSSASNTTYSQSTDSGCLTAKEARNHIGENTCVIFYPAKFAKSGKYFFIDEKEDYKNGFVVFIGKKDLISWNDFLARYDVGKKIKVTGKIELYDGYPEIKVYDLTKLSVVN